MYHLVRAQQAKFGLLYDGPTRHLSFEEKNFYHKAFLEEVQEYFEAASLEDEYDALLDLTVFTLGCLSRHGFDPRGIEEVIKCNMAKELGATKGKRNDFQLDLFKPEGWKQPDLRKYL